MMEALTRSGIAGVLLALLFVCELTGAVWGMGSRPPVIGTAASEFTLVDLEGRAHSLSQHRGNIVLVNFWATWCKPCTTEMPAMQACYDRLRDKGFVVLAVNELEDEAKVREHIKAYGHTFPVLLDQDNRVANQYGVYGLPVSVFVDQNGLIQEYVKGSLLTQERIQEVVDRLQGATAQKAATRS